MDYSQYIRLKQEAANQYVARMKTTDSSHLTLQRQAIAAYGGRQADKTENVPVKPVAVPYDAGSCPVDHQITGGFQPVINQTNENLISRAAGGVLCCQPDYSKISPGIQLLNCSTVTTILTSYNNNTPAPGEWPAHGYGQNTYFPSGDKASAGVDCTDCGPNKYPYSS
jgi:hypothetical protein